MVRLPVLIGFTVLACAGCGDSSASDDASVVGVGAPPVFVFGNDPGQRVAPQTYCWAATCADGELDTDPVDIAVESTGEIVLRLDADDDADLTEWEMSVRPADEAGIEQLDQPLSVRTTGSAAWEVDLGDWPGGTVLMFASGPGGDVAASVDLLRPAPTAPTRDQESADEVPSWAGDHSMPPAVTVRGSNEVQLRPWTWGWTSPPNDSGEQESIVADGIPPDPLDIVEHGGVVDLEYPLAGWTFTAVARDEDSTQPLVVSSGDDNMSRIDVAEVPDGTTIVVVGRASPGEYELIVSFSVVRGTTAIGAAEDAVPTMAASPMPVAAGSTLEVSFTGSLNEMRGGFFLLADSSGRPVAMLWSDKFEGEGQGFDLDAANAPVLDFGVVVPGPDTLVLPPGLDAGIYKLCTENSRPAACTTIEIKE